MSTQSMVCLGTGRFATLGRAWVLGVSGGLVSMGALGCSEAEPGSEMIGAPTTGSGPAATSANTGTIGGTSATTGATTTAGSPTAASPTAGTSTGTASGTTAATTLGNGSTGAGTVTTGGTVGTSNGAGGASTGMSASTTGSMENCSLEEELFSFFLTSHAAL